MKLTLSVAAGILLAVLIISVVVYVVELPQRLHAVAEARAKVQAW